MYLLVNQKEKKMNKNIFGFVGVALAVMMLSGVAAQAQEKKRTHKESVAKVKDVGTPGDEHAVLNPFVGKWKVTGHFWVKPNDEPHISSGTSSIKWTLDGRMLKEEFKGNWFGEPVEGLGYIGYDTMKKKYVSVWMDSLSTSIFHASGKYNSATKTLQQSGRFSYPVTGNADQPFREEWKIVDNDTHLYVMYVKGAKGKEFKSMELTYKRKR